MVTNVVRRISRPYVGYLFLLLGFTFLGLFVAALAFGSHLAVAAGVAMAGAFGGSVASFRPWAPNAAPIPSREMSSSSTAPTSVVTAGRHGAAGSPRQRRVRCVTADDRRG